MAFSPCTTFSDADLNIDDYFDFDAASCDFSKSRNSWGFQGQNVGKDQQPTDFDESMLERLTIDTCRDHPHALPSKSQGKAVDVYAAVHQDGTLGLPETRYGIFESPEADESSDSESSCSFSGSPFSFSSSLSPPLSHISSGIDFGFLPDTDAHFPLANFSTNREYCGKHFLPLSTNIPAHTFVHAPRPISPRSDVVEDLENIVQAPPEYQIPVENEAAVSPPPYDFSSLSRPQSPPHYDTLVHRTKQHAPLCYPDIYREMSERDREWCCGCLKILARADSRRRHENTCLDYREYENTGFRNPKFAPLPEIYSETIEKYQMWCLKCFATFENPQVRRKHELGCDVPLMTKRASVWRPRR
ncbi:hypothetical protein B0H10DRAFT_2224784 [Mycena sp. CBHHK59/15]|nr:hypothetical protein B0H10DRAFT_2224784 [Mycena sp. CBHHK59/15]